MILVTGVSGSMGGAVAAALKQSGTPYRAMVRDQKHSADHGSFAIADFSDKKSLRSALAGIKTIFVACSPIPALVELESNVIDVAKETGVGHIVLNSALGAADYPRSFPSWHRAVEEKLKASGLGYTILRPNSFMQNILAYMAPSIRAQGAFYSAMGEAKTSYLDVRDIADVAAKALISPASHAGKTYELNGPEAVTSAELAARISRVTGREIQYVNIPEAAQRKSMLDLGMPVWQVDALLDLQRYYTGGQGGTVDDTLAELLGKPSIRLDDFLQEFKANFV